MFTPTPPTREITLLEKCGAHKRRGAYRIPVARGFKYVDPPPSPSRMSSAQDGGGIYHLSRMEVMSEDQILTPTPTPDVLTKDFRLQPGLGWKFLLPGPKSAKNCSHCNFQPPANGQPDRKETQFTPWACSCNLGQIPALSQEGSGLDKENVASAQFFPFLLSAKLCKGLLSPEFQEIPGKRSFLLSCCRFGGGDFSRFERIWAILRL